MNPNDGNVSDARVHASLTCERDEAQRTQEPYGPSRARVLVLGGHGMAGHMIAAYLRELETGDIWHTSRRPCADAQCVRLDVLHEEEFADLAAQIHPDVIINSVGLLNEDATRHVQESIWINALLPHRLLSLTKQFGSRLIQISTDCVFSGKRGHYAETDEKDGTSVYAKTKSLGEIDDDAALTIRTSIIGPDRNPEGIGLFHWFMRQNGDVKGFTQVWWNGVTTLELAKSIVWALDNPISGIVHLANPERISKYALLRLIQDTFQHEQARIIPCSEYRNDKTLVNTRSDFPFPVASYRNQLEDLKNWTTTHGKELYPYG